MLPSALASPVDKCTERLHSRAMCFVSCIEKKSPDLCPGVFQIDSGKLIRIGARLPPNLMANQNL